MKNAKVIFLGAGMLALVILCLTLIAGIWVWRNSQNSESTASSAPPTNAEIRATADYWAALIAIDRSALERIKDITNSIDFQHQASLFEILPKYSAQLSKLAKEYNAAICDLPVIDVDERLLAETAQDLSRGLKSAQLVSGMADAAVSYLAWNHHRQNPSGEKIFGDLLDSLIMGFEGQPFGGYEKLKAEEAELDAEGRQILNDYLRQAEALNENIRQADADKLKAMELRAYLTKKYNLEFKPRPE
jgi:hypothetical protein